jgi:hypothetical protein
MTFFAPSLFSTSRLGAIMEIPGVVLCLGLCLFVSRLPKHCANSPSRLLFFVWLFITARVSTLNKMVWLVSKLTLGHVADA